MTAGGEHQVHPAAAMMGLISGYSQALEAASRCSHRPTKAQGSRKERTAASAIRRG
jgi:hypothetical protein